MHYESTIRYVAIYIRVLSCCLSFSSAVAFPSVTMTQTSVLIVSEHSQKEEKYHEKVFCWVWWVVQGQNKNELLMIQKAKKN